MRPESQWGVGSAPTPKQIKRRRLELLLLTGRPKRDTVISADDITNLRIALALCKDVEEFLA